MTAHLTSQELISRCPGLTYRKLDYWCKGGCFGEQHTSAGSGTRRQFTEQDLRVAQIINRVSLAFQTKRGGHADLVALYASVGQVARHLNGQNGNIQIPLGPGVSLDVQVTETVGQPA